jgi:hypothetical protein
MTTSYEASIFDSLLAQIQGACSGFSTSVDPARVYLMVVPDSNNQLPAFAIRFPQQPWSQSDWATTGSKKNEKFILEIGVVNQISADVTTGQNPFQATLNLIRDLKNLLENGWSTFVAAAPELVDYQFTTSMWQNEAASPPTVSATLSIAFQIRLVAGNRN